MYTNPRHPVDMSLPELNELRKLFDEAGLRAKDKNSVNKGVPIAVNFYSNEYYL